MVPCWLTGNVVGMGLAGVCVRIAGDDFHLLAEDDSDTSAHELAELLAVVRDEGGTLRLRPRTAPAEAPWTSGEAADLVTQARPGASAEGPLTGEETPGTAWRDVEGSAIQEILVEDLDDPTVLWHWAVGADGERQIG